MGWKKERMWLGGLRLLDERHVTCEILRARGSVVWGGRARLFVQRARPGISCGAQGQLHAGLGDAWGL